MISSNKFAHVQKSAIIAEIVSKIQLAQGVAIAEYKYLTVKQLLILRRQALKLGIEVKVYKDSLVKRAVDKLNLSKLKYYLTQQNIFIFSNNDAFGAAKLVANFAKENENLKLKAGIYEGAFMDKLAITEIASMPSKEDLYLMFVSSLLYPIRKLMVGIKAVADKKSE